MVKFLHLLETLLVELLVVVVLLLALAILGFCLPLLVRTNHHATRWSLRCARLTELLLRGNENVGYSRLLAENGQVGDNVDGVDVSGEDEQAI